LDDLAKKTGEVVRLLDIERGKKLPIGIRNELRKLYNKKIREEEYIKEQCIEQSKGIFPFMVKAMFIIGAILSMMAILFG